MRVLNSNKRKKRMRKTWKRGKSANWLAINIDLFDIIDLDWSLDKPRRIINSGKKDG